MSTAGAARRRCPARPLATRERPNPHPRPLIYGRVRFRFHTRCREGDHLPVLATRHHDLGQKSRFTGARSVGGRDHAEVGRRPSGQRKELKPFPVPLELRSPLLRFNGVGDPAKSTCTSESMTRSTGTSGLIASRVSAQAFSSPPRMEAEVTTATAPRPSRCSSALQEARVQHEGQPPLPVRRRPRSRRARFRNVVSRDQFSVHRSEQEARLPAGSVMDGTSSTFPGKARLPPCRTQSTARKHSDFFPGWSRVSARAAPKYVPCQSIMPPTRRWTRDCVHEPLFPGPGRQGPRG